MATTIREEVLTDTLLDELSCLMSAHSDETKRYPDMGIGINRDAYLAMSKIGVYKLFVVRDGDRAVGYAGYIVAPHLHYRQYGYATSDVIYLAPEYRGRMVGRRLLRYADEVFEGIGVNVVMVGVKSNMDFGVMLESIGYTADEKIYSRRLQ